MTNTLRITESVSFSFLDKNWAKVRDDFGSFMQPNQQMQQDGKGVTAWIAASHAGIITRNNGFYLPERMRKGATTFVTDYQKPILLHHDEHQDAVGRVVQARYVDTSGSIQDKWIGKSVGNKNSSDIGKITRSLINDFVAGTMPFGQQVDVVRSVLRDSHMLEDSGYQGLGYVEIAAHITDPDAIQKLMDGRYLTGSVGATTDAAICSVCRTDWTETGPCDHQPGGIYDDAKCFIIAGNLFYDEYSFVNCPADRHSGVLRLDYNGKQLDIETINDYIGRIHQVGIRFPQYSDSDNEEDKGMAKDAKKTQDDNKSSGNDLEIKDSATTPTPEGDKETVADSANTETEIQDDKSADETIQDDKDGDKDTKVEDEKTQDEESVEDLAVRVLDSKEEVELSTEEYSKLYDFMWTHVEKAVKDGVLDAEDVEALKLSDEKRGRLPASAFCDSRKVLPVNDCAHIYAARAVVDSLKLSDETKQTLVSVLDRKTKVKDCKVVKTDIQDDVNSKDNMNHSRMLRMVLSVLDEDTYYSEESVLDDEEKKMFQTIIKRMATMVGKDNFQKAAQDEGLAYSETALLDEVATLEETVVELKDRLDATQKEHHLLFQDMEGLQDQLATTIADSRKTKEKYLGLLTDLKDQKVSEEKSFTNFTDSDLNSEISKTLEIVDMNKITAKLGDGMARVPVGTVKDPTEVQDDQSSQQKVFMNVNDVYQQYMYYRMGRSQQAAETYLADLKRKGLIPTDLDFEKLQGGSK